MASKINRKSRFTNYDAQAVANNCYNDFAGAQKNLAVGPKLIPIKIAENSYTTDASTARFIGKGATVHIYSESAGTVVFGADASLAAPGAAGSVTAGNVSIPVVAGQWTSLSAGEDSWIRTSAASVLVFIVQDHTFIS